MNKMKISRILAIVAAICFITGSFCAPAFAKPRWWNCTSVLGGAEGSLDSVNGQNLFDGYKAEIITTTNTYFYTLDEDSAAAEDTTSYTVVSPDSNAGDKRWILECVIYDFAFTTFTDEDTTPSVANENLFLTNTTATTVTRFDNGIAGQRITIHSKGAITFDLTANARLIGSSADIVTASGDITEWLCATGGTTASVWHLISFNDISDDNS